MTVHLRQLIMAQQSTKQEQRDDKNGEKLMWQTATIQLTNMKWKAEIGRTKAKKCWKDKVTATRFITDSRHRSNN